jgi:carbonic anhydrase
MTMRPAATMLPVLTIVALFAPLHSRGQTADYSKYVSPWKTPWEYEGPRGAKHWSELDPAYALCNTGKAQSPVDIRNAQKVHLPPLRFEYKREAIHYVINNGYTIRVNYHDAPGSGSYLIVGDKRYQLTQFHFHRPSEEYIHGKRYDMVLHLMHRASDGEEAGVAVLLTAGPANATVAELWDHMPLNEGQLAAPGVELDPADMLPNTHGYYAYTGSVTAPPCTEGVKWFILKSPVNVSTSQIAAFAKLFPNDARPPQPLNGRVVEESD